MYSLGGAENGLPVRYGVALKRLTRYKSSSRSSPGTQSQPHPKNGKQRTETKKKPKKEMVMLKKEKQRHLLKKVNRERARSLPLLTILSLHPLLVVLLGHLFLLSP